MGKKSSHPEILVICSFSPVTASTWGFFSAFNHWNILPAMFLSGKYLFGNAAFQISAMVIHTVEFVVAVQECPHFITLFMHTPGKSLTWAFNSTGGGVGWGGAHRRSWPNWQCLKRHYFWGPDVRLVSTVMKISVWPPFWMVLRNFVYGGWKCFYIYRILLFEIKIIWWIMVWYLGRVLEGK